MSEPDYDYDFGPEAVVTVRPHATLPGYWEAVNSYGDVLLSTEFKENAKALAFEHNLLHFGPRILRENADLREELKFQTDAKEVIFMAGRDEITNLKARVAELENSNAIQVRLHIDRISELEAELAEWRTGLRVWGPTEAHA